MNLFARIFHLIWGGDVDRALRPVLAVSLMGSIQFIARQPSRALIDGVRAAAEEISGVLRL